MTHEKMMPYEAWRISYQSSEQAARAAYANYILEIEVSRNVIAENEQLRAQVQAMPQGEVVVTTTEAGQCVAVTRQDEEGRILSVIWEADAPAAPVREPMTDGERVRLVKNYFSDPWAQEQADAMLQQAEQWHGITAGGSNAD